MLQQVSGDLDLESHGQTWDMTGSPMFLGNLQKKSDAAMPTNPNKNRSQVDYSKQTCNQRKDFPWLDLRRKLTRHIKTSGFTEPEQ
jgi:hypothetical protein